MVRTKEECGVVSYVEMQKGNLWINDMIKDKWTDSNKINAINTQEKKMD